MKKLAAATSVNERVENRTLQPYRGRPWEAWYNTFEYVPLSTKTKTSFEYIGIALHKVKSQQMYSMHFVCSVYMWAIDILFPI